MPYDEYKYILKGSDFLICPSCQQETEEGKFCTKCGQPMHQQENTNTSTDVTKAVEVEEVTNTEPAANKTAEPTSQEQAAPTAEPNSHAAQPQPQSETTPYTMSDLGTTIKNVSGGFGHFALTYLKSPGKARSLTEKSWVSGVISIALTALLYSILLYITLNQAISSSPPFMDTFLVPFLKFLLFFVISIAVIFGAGKILGSQDNFLNTTAKTGAYLLPFAALFVVSHLSIIIGLDFMFYVSFLTVFAPILFIPTYILMDSIPREIDKIYALIVVYAVHLFLGYYLLLEPLMESVFTNMMNNFSLF